MHNRAEQARAGQISTGRSSAGPTGAEQNGAGRRRTEQQATGSRARLGAAALPALLLAALAGSAGAQAAPPCGGTPGVPGWARTAAYRGTLGTLPIALQLTPGRFESRYFYERRSLDISLEEFRSGEQLILQETVRLARGGDSVVTGCFTLMPAATGLKGTWQAPGGRAAQPVTLNALNALNLPLNLPSSPGLQRLRRDDPLAFLKLNRTWVRSASSVREPLSGLSYPRVPAASAPLNAALQDRLLENAVSALDCRSMLPQDLQSGDGAGYELQAAVTLQRTRLLSLREDVYYDCGGAHPDNYSLGLILDRATGREVSPAVIWPKLTAARQQSLYLTGVRRQVEADCLDVLTQSTLDFTANLTPAGLNLTPTSLPHVAAACAETVVIPYAALRPDVNAASPYFPDLYAR